MATSDYSKIIFTGQRRVFFLVFVLAVFMQLAAFLHDRAQMALGLVGGDFRIAVTLNNASEKEAEEFKDKLAALTGVAGITQVNPLDTLSSLRNSGSTFSAASLAVNPDFLPSFFELKVTTPVLLNPKIWVQNNIASMDNDAAAYYKDDQALLAVYLNALIRFIDIMVLVALFALFGFGFFVEAYYTKISTARERFGGLGAGFFAALLAAAVTYILAHPAGSIMPGLKYNMLAWPQLLILALCMMSGWTLSKWKKF